MSLRSVFLFVLAGALMLADTLTLRDGKKVNGSYLGGDARSVRMAVGDRVQSFRIDDISSITFGSAPSESAAAPAAPKTQGEQRVLRPERAYNTPPPPPPPQKPTTIPSGATLTIRMIDDVDSERDTLGQTFRASTDEPVMVEGETLIPRGADVVVKLVDDKQSGRIEGKTILTLDIVSLNVGGKTVAVDTQEVTQESASRTSKSAKVIGGTAAVGAIIGAIAGGGKGAAIGAASGAGAGTAVQVLTKGQRVRIPSETRLTFTLQQPVKI